MTISFSAPEWRSLKPPCTCPTDDDSAAPTTTVLIPGALGQALDFAPIARTCDGPVFGIDLPGHGKAARPAGDAAARSAPAGPSWDELVETLVDQLVEVEGRVVLGGYSMGARLALFCAARAPHVVSALVLLSGRFPLDDDEQRLARRALDDDRASQLVASPETFVREWAELPLFAPLAATSAGPDLVKRRLARLSEESAAGWSLGFRAWGLGRMPPLTEAEQSALEGIPTLVLSGALDATFVDEGWRMTTRFPTWRPQVVPDVGHALPLEAPAAVATALREAAWMAEHTGNRGPGPTASPADAEAADEGRRRGAHDG